MAHGKDKKKQARSHYVLNRQTLPAVATLLKVPLATLRRWKAEARQNSDDWDTARAGSLVAGEAYTELIAAALEEFAVQFRAVMDAIKGDKALSAVDKTKLLAGLADAFNKTVAAAGRAAPKISELGVAYDVLQRLSAFAGRTRPDLAPALLELLEPFGDEIAEAYDGR
ncbi:DUF1804 family protein [Candidatus Tokpelaia sp.]|uniref:DUF1804 family protein n=1 Tax=Candidatus Tokpelaia sp. TaxID=2233777 RepID=UPI00123BD930|nr:DUF1804 family protein [Candidatus Tokpelaia sp.]KAA6404478.1 hypothetical protein DPQ22_09610 [Candidatus Tokpelaia sp.]